MQAILTVYKGPTNSKGSRIIASSDAGRKTFSYDHALGVEGNHSAAANAYAKHLGWLGKDVKLVSGSLPGGGEYAHVFAKK